jgi:hypothetical protein
MKKYLYLFAIIASLLSCKKKSNEISPFAGHWEGVYSGADDHGAWAISIDANGAVTGSATSMVFAQTYQLSGVVNSSGNITLTFRTATSGGTFSGILQGSTGEGIWENNMVNPSYSGRWSGNKT